MGQIRIGGPRLGRVTTPGGGAGDNAHQTLDATKRTVGPLPRGVYSVEADVEGWIVQGTAASIASSSLTASVIRAQGDHLPPATEIRFEVGSDDGYLAFVKDATAADGTIWINDRETTFPTL